MAISIWTKKYMLRPVTHCRSGCQGSMGHGARSLEESFNELAWSMGHGGELY
jgi:hypothetical protein